MSKNFEIAKIDTVALVKQVSDLIKERDNLKELLEDIQKKNNLLKESWETRTSESVFNNFQDMYKGFQELINNIDNDIKFLEKTISDYEDYENEANKEIDQNIAA